MLRPDRPSIGNVSPKFAIGDGVGVGFGVGVGSGVGTGVGVGSGVAVGVGAGVGVGKGVGISVGVGFGVDVGTTIWTDPRLRWRGLSQPAPGLRSHESDPPSGAMRW